MRKKTQQQIENEEYMAKVQDLMDVVPTSKVAAKKIDEFHGDKKNYRLVTWVIDGYTISSGSRVVCSIDANNEESVEFFLKMKDYRNFVKACEVRRAEIYKQITVKKK